MHVPALAILIALIPLSATAGDAFRAHLTNYVAAHTGCAGSRTLVERELAGFERGARGDAPASLTLFGKRAATWTEEDIRDLLAVIRTCEETGGRHFAEDGEAPSRGTAGRPRPVHAPGGSPEHAVRRQGPSQAPIAPPQAATIPRKRRWTERRGSDRPSEPATRLHTGGYVSRAATVTGAVADHGRGTPPRASAWTPSEPPAASEPPTESRARSGTGTGDDSAAVSAAGSAARPCSTVDGERHGQVHRSGVPEPGRPRRATARTLRRDAGAIRADPRRHDADGGRSGVRMSGAARKRHGDRGRRHLRGLCLVAPESIRLGDGDVPGPPPQGEGPAQE